MRKSVNWRRDPDIQERMVEVQRRHFGGMSNRAIALELDVDEGTVRNDIKRLNEKWQEHIAEEAPVLRAGVVAELQEMKILALKAAAFDEMCERAVLFGEGTEQVYRDEKGSAKFSGQKAQNLANARQAVMDKAKVLGLIVEKQEHQTPIPVRLYELEVSPHAPPATPDPAG